MSSQDKPYRTVIDVKSGKTTIEDLTSEEIAEMAQLDAELKAKEAEQLKSFEALQQKKSVLLEKLGITEEEAKLLLS
jgi:hypothetical protein